MRRAWAILQVCLAIGGIIWLGVFLHDHRAELMAILNQPAHTMALLIATVLVTWIIAAAQMKVLTSTLGVRLGWVEGFLLIAATSLLNYIPARIGTLLRLRYLRQVHGLGYGRNLGLIALRLLLLLLTCTGLTLFGVMSLGEWEAGGELLVGLGVVLALGLMLLVAPIPKPSGLVGRVFVGITEGIETARRRHDLIVVTVLLILAQLGVTAFRMHIAFGLTGEPAPLALLMIVAPITVLLTLASFATLGVREALIGAVVAISGTDFEVGVLAASAERGALLASSAVFGTLGTGLILLRLRAARGQASGEEEEAGAPVGAGEPVLELERGAQGQSAWPRP